ncbi:MAG: sodium:solute symporter family protein [Anaerovoracaceae bacterium]
MSENPLILLMICSFMFVPLFLAEIAGKKVLPTGSSFFLQSRKMGVLPMYATVFATWMSAFAFMGAIAYFYEEGPIYMTTVGWDALFALLFYLLGRRIWFYGKQHNYITATDFFSDIYGSKTLNLLVTGISFVFTILYLQVQMVGGLFLIEVATGGFISWKASGLIFFLVLVVYLWAGGLRAVTFADAFYAVLIIVTILASGFFLIQVAGGIEVVFDRLVEENLQAVVLSGGGRIGLWICMFLVVPMGAFMGPQMWIRNYAAKEERNFELLPLLLCISSIVCIGTLFAGNAGMILKPGGGAADTLIAELMLENANPIFCTFIFLGIAAAIFSTANSQIHAMSVMYAIDIHKRYINKKLPEKSLVPVAKWALLFISAIAYLMLLLIPKNIFDMGILALSGLAQLIVPVIGGLFFSRSKGKAAICGLIFGTLSFFALVIFSPLDTSISAVLALGLNGLTFVLLSFLLPQEPNTKRKIIQYKQNFTQGIK